MTTTAVEPVTPKVSTDSVSAPSRLSWLREGVAAFLAIAVVALFGTVVIWTLSEFISATNATLYERAKDLIGIVNGIFGVVIGYYFQKSTSDTQIERANKAAETATEKATEAEQQAKAVVQKIADAVEPLASSVGTENTKAEVDTTRIRTALDFADVFIRR